MKLKKLLKLLLKLHRIFPVFVLYLIFKFDSWHLRASQNLGYVESILEMANRLEERKKVVEIGCGLGNILKNLDFQVKHGYDIDKKIIAAAKILGALEFNSAQFFQGGYQEIITLNDYDLVVMINWPHTIDSRTLQKILESIKNRILTPNGFIIIEGVPGYRHYHDESFFNQLGNIINTKNIDGREIYLIQIQEDK